MRKIESPKEKERREGRNRAIISMVLVGILVLSTAGYAFYNINKEKVETVNYNGLEFVKQNNFWITNVAEKDFFFSYLPNETVKININLNKNLGDFINKPLYFSEQNIAKQEILRNIEGLVARTPEACLDEKNCKDNLPIKNCSDNFIIFQKQNITMISQEENCIYILIKQGEETKAADAFLYRVLGII